MRLLSGCAGQASVEVPAQQPFTRVQSEKKAALSNKEACSRAGTTAGGRFFREERLSAL